MTEDRLYLGTGWAFPPAFTKNQGVATASGEEDIHQSLGILLTTTPGERIFRPDYGCNIRRWVFAKMNLSEKTLIIDAIKQAIMKGEPRITLLTVEVSIKNGYEGILWIHIEYIINSTNSPSNIVFPFYFGEGTDY